MWKRATFVLLCITTSVIVFLYKRDATSSLSKYFHVVSYRLDADFIHRTPLNKTNIDDSYKKLLLNLRKHLSPLASITQRLEFADPPLNKTQRNIIYQTGTGLEKIIYKNVTTWREFGVTYIPANLTKLTRTNIADVFSSDYVPLVAYNHDLFFEGRKHEKVPESQRKIILAKLAVLDPIDGLEPLKACPDFPCLQTTNTHKYFQNSSAITFDGSWRGLHDRSVAPKRSPDQIFIYYNYEAIQTVPVLRNKSAGWTDAFNWTMSYNVDAEIFMPYGLVRKRPTPLVKNYSSILSNKSKFIAVFISHCPTRSRREEYVRQLQAFVPVHVYGSCGPYKCNREHDMECFTNVSRDYKFYLAFENNICPDYITEKFFKNFKTDSVMVVREATNYYKHLPEGTYINTNNFKTPKDLALHLKYLDYNDEAYLDILRKKEEYFAAYDSYPHLTGNAAWVNYNWENVPLCEVCQRLWNIDLYSHVYTDIAQWNDERACHDPIDL